MTKGIDLCESRNRGSGATRTPTGVRALTEVGKGNLRGRGACPVVSTPVTTRASASGARGRAILKVIPAVVAAGPGGGTSIMVCEKERSRNEASTYSCKER